MLKFLKRLTRKQDSQIPSWTTDQVYAILFEEVERVWDRDCKDNDHAEYWQYVLVEEWSSSDGPMCGGELVRAWVRDLHGLAEISLQEHMKHKSKIKERLFPFVIVFFHVYPDRTHVVLCHQGADTAGGGERYIVTGDGTNIKLEPDPSGGFWIS